MKDCWTIGLNELVLCVVVGVVLGMLILLWTPYILGLVLVRAFFGLLHGLL